MRTLFSCVRDNDPAGLDRLIIEGSEVYSMKFGVLPMYTAICMGRTECVMVLAKYMNTGDIICIDDFSSSLYCSDACIRYGRRELLSFFLEMETLKSLRRLYFRNLNFVYSDFHLDMIRSVARRRIAVCHMLVQFEQRVCLDCVNTIKGFLFV